ncbi:dihydrofolate reductase [Catenulispora sp. EB89]|uniref:dihydrofolate reductase family protein n=1 Tax=Catenulispora sp. EB89 TaxID=3156257 RepID=UPI0035116B7F
MPLVRVHNFSISLDGFGTGEDQTFEAPFGTAGQRLTKWFVATSTFRAMFGSAGGSLGVDNAFAARWNAGVGAEIMGRAKFGPQTGAWKDDDDWKGWWGAEPPFHTPCFVLSHHPHPPITMEGGTSFQFLDATPEEALRVAQEAAGDLDVRIGGGPTTVREFLAADLIDEMHLAVVPIVLGRGVRLWDGLEGVEERFDVETVASPSGVVHLTFRRRPRTEAAHGA